MNMSRISALALSLLASSAAIAHHPMGGQTPETLMQGLLSGVGHPIIGIDHFAFVLALGFLAALLPTASRLAQAAAFAIATVIGTLVHLQSWDLPAAELLIALSVLLAGVFVLSHKKPALPLLLAGVTVAGLFHGYAYGEAIVGAETTPLLAYLFGFATLQFAVIQLEALLINRLGAGLARRGARVAGTAIAAVGAYFAALQLV